MDKKQFRGFVSETKTAWETVTSRWKPTLLLLLITIVPLLFVLPYMIEVVALGGVMPVLQGSTIATFAAALFGTIAFLVVSTITNAGFYILYASSRDVALYDLLRRGTERFFPYVFTQIWVFLFMAYAALPFAAVKFWYFYYGSEFLGRFVDVFALQAIVLLADIILLIPVFVVAVWTAFAPLATVLKDGETGADSLRKSTTIVRPNFRPVALRLVGWLVFTYIMTQAVSPLPYLGLIIPIALAVTGLAFNVVVYKEAYGEEKASVIARRAVRRSR